MTKEEVQVNKRIENFQKKYLKLMAEYPSVTLRGDENGNITATTYIGPVHVKRQLPNYVTMDTSIAK